MQNNGDTNSRSNNYLYTLKTSDNTKIRLSRNANTPGGNYYNPSGNNYTGEIEVKAGDFLSFTDMGKGGQSFNRIKNAKIVASAEDGTKLYVSTRGQDLVSVIDLERMAVLQDAYCGGKHPRDFILTENTVLCANRYSDTVVAFTRNPDGTVGAETGRINIPQAVSLAVMD